MAGSRSLELALTLPLLVLALLGGGDMARAFALQIAVQNGAASGRRVLRDRRQPDPVGGQTAALAEINRTPGANASLSDVTVTRAQSDGVTACVGTPTVATPCFVSVRVRYSWSTIIAWPLVPNGGTFDRTTSVRMFY